MKRLIMLCVVLFCASNYSYSQEGIKGATRKQSSISNQEKYEVDVLMKELSGTYQFKIIDSQIKPMLTLEILQMIKSSRDENETIVVDMEDGVKLVIPSHTEIKSNGFSPLPSSIYISTK